MIPCKFCSGVRLAPVPGVAEGLKTLTAVSNVERSPYEENRIVNETMPGALFRA